MTRGPRPATNARQGLANVLLPLTVVLATAIFYIVLFASGSTMEDARTVPRPAPRPHHRLTTTASPITAHITARITARITI